ncbi:MAG: ATP-binding cassette domain-containing protein [Thermoanaerobaculia bacterium]
MDAIRIEGLTKNYGSVRALDGLDLTVASGSVFGFLGPNGAGKTTTIRILTGLAHASGGRAVVSGAEVTAHLNDASRRIGHLAEEPAFYSWMTAGEFLDHVARMFELPPATRVTRVGELLEMVGLADVRARRISGFSRGMRQRLGIAQALVNTPDVVFLDEPTSALDPAGRRDVLDLIEQLSGHCTVFMSSHILGDVERVCDTIGIVANGKLVTQAPREELLADYSASIFEVETKPDLESRLAEWATGLGKLPWIESISAEGSKARIVVQDADVATRELLASVVAADLALIRYELMRPSLEDVFLHLVREGRAT